jgi:small subunit ribosomal protein S1
MSVSRISHPRQRFRNGQSVRAVVSSIENGRISLSHKELLGSWEENAADYRPGETVRGIVRSVEEYGIFVELTPNLAGLAEKKPDIYPGMAVSVFIKSILPERMKVKLVIIDSLPDEDMPLPIVYRQKAAHIDRWVYSPANCPRLIETVF